MINRRETLRRSMPVLAALLGGAGLAACRQTPIYQGTTGQFQGRGSLADREAQIRRAAASLSGWTIQPMRPGLLRATNSWRSHQMVVDIAFDIRSFTIRYVDSMNLDYDGTQIHSAYNSRVQQLEEAIMRTPPVMAGRGPGGSDATPVSGPIVSGE